MAQNDNGQRRGDQGQERIGESIRRNEGIDKAYDPGSGDFTKSIPGLQAPDPWPQPTDPSPPANDRD